MRKEIMRLGLSLFFVLCCAQLCQALEWRESPEISAIFRDYGVTGTFVLYNATEDFYLGTNVERAASRFFPASTFKIVNTLISLTSGTVSDVDEVLPYYDEPDSLPAWRRDMSLRDAIVVSNLPIYRELARRIGRETMAIELRRLRYGNAEIGDKIDSFWLGGPLAISALEQSRFLARLAKGELPVAQDVQESVREILLQKRDQNTAFYAKTGATASLGWWVGWLENNGKIYSFALNIDMPDFDAGLPLRLEIGKKCLNVLGLW